MAIEMQNNLEADGSVKAPTKADGTLYRLCMYFDNNRSIVFSDDTGELIARLIPGYKALGIEDKKDERVNLLNLLVKSNSGAFTIADFDLPEDPNSLGYGSEDTFLRSLHKLGFINLFEA